MSTPAVCDDKVLNIKQYTDNSFLVWGKDATMKHKVFLADQGGKYGKFFKKATMKERGLKPEILDDRSSDENFKAWMFPLKKRSTLLSELVMGDIEFINWDEK